MAIEDDPLNARGQRPITPSLGDAHGGRSGHGR